MDLREMMTPRQAAVVYPVAMNAAMTAEDSGDMELGTRLLEAARLFRSIRRYGRVSDPALPDSPVTVKAADLPAEVTVLGRMVSRMGAWGDGGPVLIGSAVLPGRDVSVPVWLKKHGASVRYIRDEA